MVNPRTKQTHTSFFSTRGASACYGVGVILILFLYILAIFQTSFLVQFNISGVIPNFILILVILLNFFENHQKNSGLFAGICGGFFLDIFSENFIGFNVLILLGISILIKIILRRYVRISFIKKF